MITLNTGFTSLYTQENKSFLESIHTRLNECKDRTSDLEDQITVRDYEKKDILKLAWDHE